MGQPLLDQQAEPLSSPLSEFQPESKDLMFSRAAQLLRDHGAQHDPDPAMLMMQNAGEAPLTKRQIFEKMQQGADALESSAARARASLSAPPINDMIPFLRGVSGALRPTKTGSFGETLGSGLGEFSAGLADQEKLRLNFAEKAAELDYRTGKDRAEFVKEGLGLGLRADQIEAMLKTAKSRLAANRFKVLPLVGLVDTMSVDERGVPRVAIPQPQFQKMLTQYEADIEKAANSKVFTSVAERDSYKQKLRDEYAERYFGMPPGSINSQNLSQWIGGTQPITTPVGGQRPDAGGATALAPASAPAPSGAPADAGSLDSRDLRARAGAPAATTASVADPRMKNSPELAGDTESAKKLSENEAKYADSFVHEMQGQSDQKYLLDRMQQDFRSLPSDPGKLLSMKAAISAWKMALGIGTDSDRALAANTEALNKEAGQLMSAWLKTLTSRPTQMEVAMALDRFIPNAGLTRAGAMKLLDQMRAAAQRGYHRADKYLNEWRPAHKPAEYLAFPAHWEKNYGKEIPFEMPAESGDGPLSPAEVEELKRLEEKHGKR